MANQIKCGAIASLLFVAVAGCATKAEQKSSLPMAAALPQPNAKGAVSANPMTNLNQLARSTSSHFQRQDPSEYLSVSKKPPQPPVLNSTNPEAESAATSTFLKKILRSPAHARIPTESSDALEFGIKLHTAVLEPDEFEHNFMVAQECTAIKKSDKKKCTNAGVMIAASDGEWKCGVHSKGQHWHKGYANVETIDPADRDKCLFMRDSILKNPAARDVMLAEDAIKEMSGEVELESGIVLRIRPDVRVRSMGIIPDLKSTKDVRHDPFVKQCVNLGYHISAAMYRDVAEMIDSVLGR